MTQVAEPGSAAAPMRPSPAGSATGSAARIVAGTSGREGPVYDPATGTLTKHVDFASAEEVDAAVAAAKAAFPAWRATSLSKRTDIMFRIRNLVEAHRHELAALPDRRARQGPLRRPRRDRPRPREPRVRDAASRTCSRAASPSRSRAASTSTRSASRSASWPASRRSTSRRWSRCGCSRPRSRAATRSSSSRPRRTRRRRSSSPSCSHEAGVPDGVFNVVHGDKVAVDAILEHPDIAAVSLRRLDADRALHLRDRHAARQARPGARRRQEPHDRAARRRHRHGRRRGGLGRLRLGRRALHGDRDVVAVGDVADPLVEAIKARLPKIKVGPGSDPGVRDGPARHPAAPRQGRLVPRLAARPRARRSSPTAASTRSTTSRTGSSWASR